MPVGLFYLVIPEVRGTPPVLGGRTKHGSGNPEFFYFKDVDSRSKDRGNDKIGKAYFLFS